MGIESLLQQNLRSAGLAGSDRLARNAMFPQAQMDKTQYATPSQMPTSAEAIRADYDTPTNAYTGLPTQPFAMGGIARFADGGGPESEGKVFVGDENSGRWVDPSELNPAPQEEVKPPTMAELAAKLKEQYNANLDYEPTWKQFAAMKESDPAQWHKYQLEWLGHHQGWQIGQNRSERNAAEMPVIQDEIEQARKAGVSDEEIQQILSGSSQAANIQNQRRIAQEAAANKAGGFGGMVMPAAGIAAMIAAPYLAPMIAPGLTGALAAGALTGGALGGLGAGMSGGNIGEGILKGGVTGAAGAGITSGLSGLDPQLAQGLNTAKNAYNVAQSGGKNMSANINAFRGIANMAPTTAAQGGLMASGGIASLGSYSDGGHLLRGPGDGMSDNIPATISGKQPARLADGEFVIPADVVSHLGNGSTDAGAKQLYKMMDRIRHARTGNKKQGKRINPNKFLPKG